MQKPKIHHNFDTHALNWRQMLVDYIALCKDRDEDVSWLEHELKAYDMAFEHLNIIANRGEVTLDGDDIR